MSRRNWTIISILLVCIIGIIVYGLYNPAEVDIFPKCPFLMLTGLKCPGCGSQRAIHQLLHFNVAGAFKYNALMVISIPVLVFLLIAELLKVGHPKLYSFTLSRFFCYSIIALILLWWILRNIFGL